MNVGRSLGRMTDGSSGTVTLVIRPITWAWASAASPASRPRARALAARGYNALRNMDGLLRWLFRARVSAHATGNRAAGPPVRPGHTASLPYGLLRRRRRRRLTEPSVWLSFQVQTECRGPALVRDQ